MEHWTCTKCGSQLLSIVKEAGGVFVVCQATLLGQTICGNKELVVLNHGQNGEFVWKNNG